MKDIIDKYEIATMTETKVGKNIIRFSEKDVAKKLQALIPEFDKYNKLAEAHGLGTIDYTVVDDNPWFPFGILSKLEVKAAFNPTKTSTSKQMVQTEIKPAYVDPVGNTYTEDDFKKLRALAAAGNKDKARVLGSLKPIGSQPQQPVQQGTTTNPAGFLNQGNTPAQSQGTPLQVDDRFSISF